MSLLLKPKYSINMGKYEYVVSMHVCVYTYIYIYKFIFICLYMYVCI